MERGVSVIGESVLKSNARYLADRFALGLSPHIFGIGGLLVTMATQAHNDLLRAGQSPGTPFSLTDTVENRPQSPVHRPFRDMERRAPPASGLILLQ